MPPREKRFLDTEAESIAHSLAVTLDTARTSKFKICLYVLQGNGTFYRLTYFQSILPPDSINTFNNFPKFK